MALITCPDCQKEISSAAAACPHCGRPMKAAAPAPRKNLSRTTAGLLALLLGGLGFHKFYLGSTGMGFVYLVFCWTFIPAIIAFFEAIVLFSMDDAVFAAKYSC